jgi:catechol 2,3-dioxygenase-like lactoylglutathione lyase family enzyme
VQKEEKQCLLFTAAIAFYTTHFGFRLISKTLPAFADVERGDLRLLPSGHTSSAGRPMPDGRQPTPGGWNGIHLIVEDLVAEVDRLLAVGVHFRNDIATGPGGSQILLHDPQRARTTRRGRLEGVAER